MCGEDVFGCQLSSALLQHPRWQVKIIFVAVLFVFLLVSSAQHTCRTPLGGEDLFFFFFFWGGLFLFCLSAPCTLSQTLVPRALLKLG